MDNLMLGGYSELSISAVTAANQVQFMLQMLVMGICEGIVVLSSQYWGQRRTMEIKQIVGIGMQTQMLLTAVYFLFVFFFPAQAARIITTDESVIAETVLYLRILCFSYLFFCVSSMLVSAMRVVETVRIGVIINITALVVNIVLNYILIYGKLGAPAMGIRGAALATLISRVVECAVALVYVLRFDQKLRLRVRDFFARDYTFLRDYLSVGLPVLLANLVWAISTTAQGAIIGRLGAQALAASGIADTLYKLLYVAGGSVSSISAVVIGKTVGEGDIGKVKSYTYTLQVLYLAVGALSGLGLFLVTKPILSFYRISPETYAITKSFLLVLSITIIGSCYQVPCLTGIVRGGGDTRFVLVNDMIFQWLIVLPSSILAAFVFRLPPVFVYVFLKSDQILKCFVALVKVNRFRWIRMLTR
jgi:putative MATE family efflux protein